jgi:ABC-type antimicrobial peptide transport system permease subunit
LRSYARTHKIWGDVWARKGRTGLVSLAIFIGVAGTIALFSMGDILIRQIQEDVKEDELAMMMQVVTVNAGEELDNDEYLQRIADEVDGLTAVIGMIASGDATNGFFKLNPDDEDYEKASINAYSVPNADSAPYAPMSPIQPVRIIAGNYPQEGQQEVAIEQRMADEFDLSVGSTICLRILSPSAQVEGSECGEDSSAWTISGIVFDPYSLLAERAIYASTIAEAGDITGSSGFTRLFARFTRFETAEENANEFEGFVAEETPYGPVFYILQDPANHDIIVAARNMSGMMSFLALLALIVSGFLVINVISSIVVEQKRQIGVMKSLGATRWDNFLMYAGIAFTYGLIGVIPGVILGIPGGNAAAHGFAPTLNTVLVGFQISPSSIAIGIIVGLLVPVFAAIVPVFFGTRVKILDAMIDLGIDADYGTGLIARFISILPVPVTVRQGLSNVSLKKSRLTMTVVTLSIAVGAFMGIYAVFSSISGGIGSWFDLFNVEIMISPVEGRDPDEIYAILDTFDDVLASRSPGYFSQITFDGYAPEATSGGPPGIMGFGYDIRSDTPAFSVDVTEGDDLTVENADYGVIFTSTLAGNMGKTIGDTVTMNAQGYSFPVTIVGIADYGIDQIWIDWERLALETHNTIGSPPPPNQYFTTVTIGDTNTEVDVLGMDLDILVGAGITSRYFGQLLQVNDGEFFTQGAPGIIISQAMADSGNYSVGDLLTLNATNGTGNSGTHPITGIVELSNLVPAGQIPDQFIGMYWQDLIALEEVSLSGVPKPQSYFLVTNLDDPSADETEEIMDNIADVLLDEGIPSEAMNFVAFIESFNSTMTTIQIVMQGAAGLIALIGALGLLTTLSMSVFERQKEIGVMRSIGASSNTVVVQFLTEGFVVGIIAWLVGIPLGYFIQVGLLSATGMSETFPAVFSVPGTIIGLVALLIITTIASLWPSLTAARKTVSDVLRYQ